MAADEPRQQILHMIRELSSERTIEERRIFDLKKRILECQTNYETASDELEKAKLERQAAERKLQGSLVQLNRICASLLMMETRRSGLQDEFSQVSSKLHAIKNASEIEGDNFVRAMQGFNLEIRKFNEMSSQALKNRQPDISTDSDQRMDMENKKTQNNLENEILLVDAQMQKLRGDYRRTVDDADKVREELAYLKKKVSLSEAIMLQSGRLKDLSTYPFLQYSVNAYY
ncbi:hypothetical protein KSP39_PZI021112 [Platanthera zijinensis]|uniref:Uncharacterized protein n=1 Tax=Platanthera zijinensis TaxID=2320716 RepID=A0AAP0FVB8_9ASPA